MRGFRVCFQLSILGSWHSCLFELGWSGDLCRAVRVCPWGSALRILGHGWRAGLVMINACGTGTGTGTLPLETGGNNVFVGRHCVSRRAETGFLASWFPTTSYSLGAETAECPPRVWSAKALNSERTFV